MSTRIILAVAAVCGLGFQQGPKVYGGVHPKSIEEGGTAELRIVVEGPSAEGATLDLPEIDGLELIPPAGYPEMSHQTSITEERMVQRTTATFRIQIIALKSGTYSIPRFEVRSPGGTSMSPRLTLNVLPTSNKHVALARLNATASRNTAYIGEPVAIAIDLDLRLPYADSDLPDMRRLFLPELTPKVGMDPLTDPVQPFRLGSTRGKHLAVPIRSGRGEMIFTRNDAASTRPYRRYTAQLRWLPTKAGTYSFGNATYTADVPTRVERVRGFFEDRLVAKETRSAIAISQPVKITVRALPRQGRPARFSGLIGEIQQTVSIDRSRAAVGQSLKLTREISGSGNLEFVDPPAIVLPDIFKTFGTLVRREPGRIVQVVDFAPRTADATTIPPIELSSFDSTKGVYLTVASAPIELIVKGQQGEGLALLPGTVTAANDLRGLKLEPGGRNPVRRPGVVVTAIVMGAPFGIGLIGLLVGSLRRRRLSDTEGLRRRSAPGRFKKALREATDAHGVRAALAGFLAELTGKPAGVFSTDVRDALEGVLSDQLLIRLEGITVRCDEAAFGGAELDVKRIAGEIEDLIPRLMEELC